MIDMLMLMTLQVQGPQPFPREPPHDLRDNMFPQRSLVGAAEDRALGARPLADASHRRGHPGGRLLRHGPPEAAAGRLLRRRAQGEDHPGEEARGADQGQAAG